MDAGGSSHRLGGIGRGKAPANSRSSETVAVMSGHIQGFGTGNAQSNGVISTFPAYQNVSAPAPKAANTSSNNNNDDDNWDAIPLGTKAPDTSNSGGFGAKPSGGRGGFGSVSSSQGARGGFGSANFNQGSTDGSSRFDSARSGAGGTGCHKCGKDGHFARECPDANGGKPAPVYVQRKINREALFETTGHTGTNFARYHENKEISVSGGGNIPSPIESFSSANLHDLVVQNVAKAQYFEPTPVQRYGIPIVGAGRDLMARAETGSGKTAAFLLPILSALLKDPSVRKPEYNREQHPLVLCVCPTRELSIQIYEECLKFSYGEDVGKLKAVNVYGGVPPRCQSDNIKEGCNIVIGTTGRIKDFCTKGFLVFDRLKYFILDEADRMLDMGFHEDIMYLNTMMPKKGQRQTLMFSATFSTDVQRLASEFLHDHVFLNVGEIGAANEDVQQTVLLVAHNEKQNKLLELLRADLLIPGAKDDNGKWTKKTIIFAGRKRVADFIALVLSQNELPATSIHGDRAQSEREEATDYLKSGKVPILVASDVFSRGMDVPGVDHIINYDMPSDIEIYIHRVGRTGRIGNIGKATSFYNPNDDRHLASGLIQVLGKAKQIVPDWLLNEVGSGVMGTAFGVGNVNISSAPKAAVEDETW